MPVAIGRHGDRVIPRPASVPDEINFNRENDRRVRRLFQMHDLLIETRHNIRIGDFTRFDILLEPYTAPASGLAHLPQVIHLPEPQACLRLPLTAICLVAAHDE